MENQNLQQMVSDLKQRLETLEQKYAVHQHDNIDGTNVLRKSINLNRDQSLTVGLGQHQSLIVNRAGDASDELFYAISVGEGSLDTGFVNKSEDLQLNFQHYPNQSNSFITCARKPLVASFEGTSVSTSSGGNTVTIAGFNFITDELVGGLISIFNSSGVFIETQTISSNTSTVITITGTWLASTSSATFLINRPVFLGSAENIWQRVYVQEGTPGGVRFGVGPTAGGQNGLLYMDATGDLYWRNKSGTSTKLN